MKILRTRLMIRLASRCPGPGSRCVARRIAVWKLLETSRVFTLFICNISRFSIATSSASVLATGDCGQVTAIQFSRLAAGLRSSVSKGTRLSLRIRVQVQTEPLTNFLSRLSANPNHQMGYIQWSTTNPSELGGASEVRPAGSAIDSYTALSFQVSS